MPRLGADPPFKPRERALDARHSAWCKAWHARQGGSTVRAVRVHNPAQVAAALAAAAAGTAVVLVSAPGAALALGAPWFVAMVAQGAAAVPGVAHRAVLDCGAAPGLALAALRLGLRWLVLAPGVAARPQVAAVAALCGATLLDAPPPALEMAGLRLDTPGGRIRLAQWLRNTPSDTREGKG